MEESKDVKCGRCKGYKYPSQFFKEGLQMNTCSDCRERSKRYQQSEKGKETKRKYNHSEKGKESFRKYQQSEKGKEKKAECMKRYRDKSKSKKHLQSVKESTNMLKDLHIDRCDGCGKNNDFCRCGGDFL